MTSLKERFDAKWTPEPNTGCWLWMGAMASGYGMMKVLGKHLQAHRVAYSLYRHEPDPGLVLDHLCRVTCCVNPDHLEPVTQRENTLRGNTLAAMHAAKTHCSKGHEFTAENTKPRVYGGRACRECHRADGRRRYAEQGRR